MGLFDRILRNTAAENKAATQTTPESKNVSNNTDIQKARNSLNGMYAPLLEQFGFGRKKPLYNQTSPVTIQKEEFYRGVGYGVLRKAINTGIVTAEENIRTTCSSTQREILAERGDQIEHPYITLYRNSPYFSEYDFWKWYLLYIQLKGEFYIYLDRKPIAGNQRYKAKNLMTMPKYMRIINPYEMTINYDKNGDVESYTQTVKRNHDSKTTSFTRDIPAYQIIHVTEVNPFDTSKPYSLLDATGENFYTLKNAQDFTRHAVVNNTNSPMMISTGEFETEESFDNFVARVLNHEDGEPIIASGSGEVKVQELNQNLDGASLEKINQMNRDEIFIATGASKSVLGVETTGLTRDVAATQKLTYIENTVVPMIKLMIETLNYDYRTMYPLSFAVDKYIMHVTTPSTGDKAQELKELEVREQEYNLVEKYVARGYTRKSAAQYVRGEIDVEQLQLEGDQPKMTPEESTDLVDSVERWQELISAGNNPDDVIALVEGKISLGDFLKRNKDVVPKVKSPESGANEDAEETETPSSDSEGTYYDPDDDYSTPRDLKTPKAEKKKKDKENKESKKDKKDKQEGKNRKKQALDLEGLVESVFDITATFDCALTKDVVEPLIDPMLPTDLANAVCNFVVETAQERYNTAKKQNEARILKEIQDEVHIPVKTLSELQEKVNPSKQNLAKIQAEINNINYGIINKELAKKGK